MKIIKHKYPSKFTCSIHCKCLVFNATSCLRHRTNNSTLYDALKHHMINVLAMVEQQLILPVNLFALVAEQVLQPYKLPRRARDKKYFRTKPKNVLGKRYTSVQDTKMCSGRNMFLYKTPKHARYEIYEHTKRHHALGMKYTSV